MNWIKWQLKIYPSFSLAFYVEQFMVFFDLIFYVSFVELICIWVWSNAPTCLSEQYL